MASGRVEDEDSTPQAAGADADRKIDRFASSQRAAGTAVRLTYLATGPRVDFVSNYSPPEQRDALQHFSLRVQHRAKVQIGRTAAPSIENGIRPICIPPAVRRTTARPMVSRVSSKIGKQLLAYGQVGCTKCAGVEIPPRVLRCTYARAKRQSWT